MSEKAFSKLGQQELHRNPEGSIESVLFPSKLYQIVRPSSEKKKQSVQNENLASGLWIQTGLLEHWNWKRSRKQSPVSVIRLKLVQDMSYCIYVYIKIQYINLRWYHDISTIVFMYWNAFNHATYWCWQLSQPKTAMTANPLKRWMPPPSLISWARINAAKMYKMHNTCLSRMINLQWCTQTKHLKQLGKVCHVCFKGSRSFIGKWRSTTVPIPSKAYHWIKFPTSLTKGTGGHKAWPQWGLWWVFRIKSDPPLLQPPPVSQWVNETT